MYTIERVTKMSDELLQGIAKLTAQISPDEEAPTADKISNIVNNKNAVLLIAREDASQAIVGMATTIALPTVHGTQAHLEDLVVEKGFRHQGLGERLTTAQMQEAEKMGADRMVFTSSSSRTEAHSLYKD